MLLTLRDCCPEQGNLRAFVGCLNLAHTEGVFGGLIRKRDGVSSLSFKGSQHTQAGGSPHSTGSRHGSPCPGMLHMLRVVALSLPWEVTDVENCGFILSLGKAELLLFSPVPQFPFLPAVILFAQSRNCPTGTHTAKHQGHGWGCWTFCMVSDHIQRDFQRFMAMKIHLSSKNTAKVLGQLVFSDKG